MKDAVKTFWEKKASEASSSIRWTGPEMLRVDSGIIQGVMNELNSAARSTWLDIGSGSGDLQRALGGGYAFCLATDAEPGMSKFYGNLDRTAFLALPFDEITGVGSFDLVTAFGLVTCLNQELEQKLYGVLADFTQKGSVIVKNQVTSGNPKTVSKFSPELKAEYFGWYPNVEEQQKELKKYFSSVNVEKYPRELNPHPDSFHAAFICRK